MAAHWVYIIELSDRAGERLLPDKPVVYVGQAALTQTSVSRSTAEVRAHLGGSATTGCGFVRTCSPRCRPHSRERKPSLRGRRSLPGHSRTRGTSSRKGARCDRLKARPSARVGTLDPAVEQAAQKGLRLYQGDGVRKDPVSAFGLLLQAATAGHAGAQYGVAMMFFRGEGVPKDDKKALHWFIQAAENGLPQAQHEASVFLLNGVGCTPDPAQAFQWCQRAADGGHLSSGRPRWRPAAPRRPRRSSTRSRASRRPTCRAAIVSIPALACHG